MTPHYLEILEVQRNIAENTNDFVQNSDCKVKASIDVAWHIGPRRLLEIAIKMAMNFQTIHQIASAGCPVGELPDETFMGISELAEGGDD